jgi:hypothetical protein
MTKQYSLVTRDAALADKRQEQRLRLNSHSAISLKENPKERRQNIEGKTTHGQKGDLCNSYGLERRKAI